MSDETPTEVRPTSQSNDASAAASGSERTDGNNTDDTADYRRGYICGLVRGDGTVGSYSYARPGRTNADVHRFRLALTDLEALRRGREYLRDAGVYYRVYDKAGANEREWPLAHVPLLIDEKEWAEISAGLAVPDTLGVHSEDPATLVVELARPTPYFLSILAHPATFPIHRGSLAASGRSFAKPGVMVSNGAFVLARWDFGSHLVAVRNRKYRNDAANRLDAVE